MSLKNATPQQLRQIEVLSQRFRDQKKYCEKCKYLGVTFFIDNDNSVNYTACSCKSKIEQELKLDQFLPSTNIPKLYWSLDFRSYRNQGRNDEEKKVNDIALKKLYSYRDNIDKYRKEGIGVYLQGPSGVGKTFLATSLGKEAIRRGYRVRFYLLSEIVTLIMNGWNATSDRGSDLAILKTVDFLIIDDADKMYKSESGIQLSLFDDLLRSRVQNQRPCIVTANTILSSTEKSFNKALHSLLLGQSVEVTLVGKDFRKTAFEERIAKINGLN